MPTLPVWHMVGFLGLSMVLEGPLQFRIYNDSMLHWCLLYLGVLQVLPRKEKDENLCCKGFGSYYKAVLNKFPLSLQFSNLPQVSSHKRGSLNGFSLLTVVLSFSSRWDLISTRAGMSPDFFWKHLPKPSPGLCSDLISSGCSSDWALISETELFLLFSQLPQFPPSSCWWLYFTKWHNPSAVIFSSSPKWHFPALAQKPGSVSSRLLNPSVPYLTKWGA